MTSSELIARVIESPVLLTKRSDAPLPATAPVPEAPEQISALDGANRQYSAKGYPQISVSYRF